MEPLRLQLTTERLNKITALFLTNNSRNRINNGGSSSIKIALLQLLKISVPEFILGLECGPIAKD